MMISMSDSNIRLPDLPVDDEAAASVKKAAQVVKRAADVQVQDVYMPVFMRQERLDKAGFLFLLIFLFHLSKSPACERMRQVLVGFTATIFWSSIMNVSRR